MQTINLEVSKIRTEGTQSRAALSTETIDDYADAYERGEDLPAIIVYKESSKNHWIADGHHRFHAAKKAKRKTIAAVVEDGTQRDALLYALGANTSHGLKRSNEDKRHAVRKLLADKEWRSWTDQRIADHCGVSVDLVATVWEKDYLHEERPTVRKALRDGKEYEVDVSKINESPRKGSKRLRAASVVNRQMTDRVKEPAPRVVRDGDEAPEEPVARTLDEPAGVSGEEFLAMADGLSDETKQRLAEELDDTGDETMGDGEGDDAYDAPAPSSAPRLLDQEPQPRALNGEVPARISRAWFLLSDLAELAGAANDLIAKFRRRYSFLVELAEDHGEQGIPTTRLNKLRDLVENDVAELAKTLKEIDPGAVCDTCAGGGLSLKVPDENPAACGVCGGLGWVTAVFHRSRKGSQERAGRAMGGAA